jgi:hypothetical protein
VRASMPALDLAKISRRSGPSSPGSQCASRQPKKVILPSRADALSRLSKPRQSDRIARLVFQGLKRGQQAHSPSKERRPPGKAAIVSPRRGPGALAAPAKEPEVAVTVAARGTDSSAEDKRQAAGANDRGEEGSQLDSLDAQDGPSDTERHLEPLTAASPQQPFAGSSVQLGPGSGAALPCRPPRGPQSCSLNGSLHAPVTGQRSGAGTPGGMNRQSVADEARARFHGTFELAKRLAMHRLEISLNSSKPTPEAATAGAAAAMLLAAEQLQRGAHMLAPDVGGPGLQASDHMQHSQAAVMDLIRQMHAFSGQMLGQIE